MFKGSVSGDFLPQYFFHDSNTFGQQKNRVKYAIFDKKKKFNFAEIFEFLRNSAVCIPQWSQTPRCASYLGVKLHIADSELNISLSLVTPKGKIR